MKKKILLVLKEIGTGIATGILILVLAALACCVFAARDGRIGG